jgi:hypothetical protein
VILVKHTSFQLYHCSFDKDYLREIHDQGQVSTGVTLCASSSYDFCNQTARGEWLDVFIALIQYLKSGESKVGNLNNALPNNMIHKVTFTQCVD